MGFAGRIKDKLRGSSSEERATARANREVATRFANENQAAIPRALQEAKDTGYPAFVARDADGHDVFVEPPAGYSAVPQMLNVPGEKSKKKDGLKVGKEMQMGTGTGFGIRQGYDPYRDENARFIYPMMKDNRGGGPRGESGWGHGRERSRYGYGYGYGGMGYGYGGMGMMGMGGMGMMGGGMMGMGMMGGGMGGGMGGCGGGGGGGGGG